MNREVMITWGPNRELVRLLTESGARFFVIGGTAVRFHVPARREPNDLDLVVEPSADMLKKVNVALAGVGAPTVLATPDEFAQPSKAFREKKVCNVDVLTPVAGLNFAEHWAVAKEATMAFSSTNLRVASVPTLLLWLRKAMNLEPTRANDIANDLDLLERLAQL